MRALGKREKAAIEAVARHVAAIRERGRGSSGAHLTVAGTRIAVEFSTLRSRVLRTAPPEPRLRFDRVALRVINKLQSALCERVPDRRTVIVTVTAPIRLPSKTAAAIESRILDQLTSRSAQPRLVERIHGNRIGVEIIKGGTSRTSKLIAFVHNPDSEPDVLFDVTRSLLACVESSESTRTRPADRRWLIIVNDEEHVPIQTYQRVYSQLCARPDFERVFMVDVGGRVAVVNS